MKLLLRKYLKNKSMKNKSLLSSPVFRATFIVALIGLVGMTFWIWTKYKTGLSSFQTGTPHGALEGLEVYGQVPDFSLLERNNQPLRLKDLQGKVWIADFIYTNCPDICLLLSAQMAEFQKDLSQEQDIRLVSISVDPERDTPEALSQYAQHYEANPNRWFFLTGEKQTIYRLAQEGFRLSVVEIAPEKRDATGASHVHGSRFVLVDRKGQIRGYYHSSDPEALKRLVRDARILLKEKA